MNSRKVMPTAAPPKNVWRQRVIAVCVYYISPGIFKVLAITLPIL
jgi:hypothetical protein